MKNYTLHTVSAYRWERATNPAREREASETLFVEIVLPLREYLQNNGIRVFDGTGYLRSRSDHKTVLVPDSASDDAKEIVRALVKGPTMQRPGLHLPVARSYAPHLPYL